MTIYFAYGSNTSREAMRRRVPQAKALGKFWLGSARLVFRGVADCIHAEGSRCPGVLWRLTPECEKALDRYEGIGSGAYRKEFCELHGFPGEDRIMFYVMNSTGIFPPSQMYLDTIKDGYREFKLPLSYLNEAVLAAWKDKNPSHLERQRYMRNGRPRLALPKKVSASSGKTGSLFTGNENSISKESV